MLSPLQIVTDYAPKKLLMLGRHDGVVASLPSDHLPLLVHRPCPQHKEVSFIIIEHKFISSNVLGDHLVLVSDSTLQDIWIRLGQAAGTVINILYCPTTLMTGAGWMLDTG